MLQFYCLSVLMNLLTGMIIVFAGDLSETNDAFAGESLDDDIFGDTSVTSDSVKLSSIGSKIFTADSFANDKTFRIILGVLVAFVGIMKLFPLASGSIPIIGDFFPAFAGIVGGACLVFDYMSDTVILPPFVQVVLDHRQYIGLFCMGVALLHFLIPQIVLF